MSDERRGDLSSPDEASRGQERGILAAVLWLNAGLAAALFTAGLMGGSSGLMANALDNLSDVAVYAMSYYAVGRNVRWKIRAARLSGFTLLLLSALIIGDVGRRYVYGSDPSGATMITMTAVAAAVNAWCLRLLRRIRRRDVNLRAAWTFSTNDLLANLGVIGAGILVAWLNTPWPDLVIGFLIAALAAKGGFGILADARSGQSSERRYS